MAIVLEAETSRTIGLEEFLADVRRNVSPADRDSLIAAAPMLRALANNRSFLVEKLNQELMNWATFQARNDQTAATLLLGGGPGFVVRANLWTPFDEQRHEEWQRQLFFYSVPHDHAFDFLTVGYHGPGYETDLYEYDRASVAGLPGEPVELVERGRARLEPGKVMLYRASQDVHSQLPPEALSISLNLIVFHPTRSREQFLFDVERRQLLGPAAEDHPTASFLCEAARHLGDERTKGLLERLATTHTNGKVRVAALETLAALEPAQAEHLWAAASDDANRVVRAVARMKRSGAEAR